MRIVGGDWKGQRISVPAGFTARPTTDFVRESLFNILDNHFYFHEIAFLDLFAGSGAISFEMYSRGCRDITTVDSSASYMRHIEAVSEERNMEGHCLVNDDAFKYIDWESRRFDLIFADPPYALPRINELPDHILRAGILVEDGYFVLECGSSHDFSQHENLIKFKRYGQTGLWFFKVSDQ